MEPPIDPRPRLLRRFVWDVFPHDSATILTVQSRLGLVPDDAERFHMEHRASDTRINRVAPLGDALEKLSDYAAEVMGQYLVCVLESNADDDEEVELPDGFYEAFGNQNKPIIYESVYAILAHLMDTGVITYGPKAGPQ